MRPRLESNNGSGNIRDGVTAKRDLAALGPLFSIGAKSHGERGRHTCMVKYPRCVHLLMASLPWISAEPASSALKLISAIAGFWNAVIASANASRLIISESFTSAARAKMPIDRRLTFLAVAINGNRIISASVCGSSRDFSTYSVHVDGSCSMRDFVFFNPSSDTKTK